MLNSKTVSKLAFSLMLISLMAAPILTAAALNFPYTRMTVAEGWAYGTDEQWHLVPVGEKNTFRANEKVQFFAQVGPIKCWHQWKLVLFKNGNQFREVTNDPFNPDPVYGWNYSNFVPYMNDLNTGDYRADYYLNTGYGYEKLGSTAFTVGAPSAPYIYDHAVTATAWQYGSGNDYWNLQPIDPKNTFNAGDKIYLLVQTRNVYVNHSYKVELYRSGAKQWEFTTQTLNVGSGWQYSNFYPYYDNAQPGSYEFKTYINVGQGFVLLATVPFTVTGSLTPYVYHHTYLAANWAHGTGTDYWNLQPVDARTTFRPGEKVYALSQVRNIYVRHQWKVELFRSGTKLWEYTNGWNDVGSGWTYGNFYPYYDNAQPGNYEFKIYINIGDGFTWLDTKAFTVSGQTSDYTYYGASVASGWTYGSGADYWNIQPVNPHTNYLQGETVYLVAQARNVYVNHRWKIETYRDGTMIWNYAAPWNNVGSGWAYSNFYPANNNSSPGSYQFKVYLDSGQGYQLLDTKPFTVATTTCVNNCY